MKIEFAKDLSFPVDIATQTVAFIARKRAGKSYAAGKVIEGLAANNVQFVIIDPVGRHYGLRLAADGKGKGIDVPVLGGLHGDIPLSADSGLLVANAIVDTGRSFVLDVSQFSLGDRKRFVTALGEQLWVRQKAIKDPQPVHVVLEEAQLFLPQGFQKGDERMIGIWTEIVRLGGNVGIGITLITQRPQSVSKEALTQVECLVVLQVNGVPEKKALKEWIVEKDLDTKLLEELPFLPRGTAYVWSPQWLGHFGKHEILPKWTFDASATPKVGAKRVTATLKPIDLTALREQMAETVKKVEENDPSALKRRIRALEDAARKVASQSSAVPVMAKVVEKEVRVEVPVLTEKDFRLLEKHLNLAAAIVDRLSQTTQVIGTEMNNLKNVAARAFQITAMTADLPWKPLPPRGPALNHGPVPGRLSSAHPNPSAQPKTQPAARPALVKGDHVVTFKAPKREVEEGDIKIPKGGREMLKALACRNCNPDTDATLTKKQIATLAGMAISGTFNTYLSSLRTLAYVGERSGGFFITARGLEFLGGDVPSAPTSTEELVELWSGKFPGKTKEMLRLLVTQQDWMTKETVAGAVGMEISGTFNTYLSSLVSNGLVERGTQGQLRASPDLFI